MHGRKLGLRRLCHKEIEALRLANERSAIPRKLNDGLHGNLPGSLLEITKLAGKLGETLNASVVCHDRRADIWCPEIAFHKILDEVLIDDDELAGKDATCLQIAREGLEALVIAQNLRCRSRRHGSHEEAVTASTHHRANTKIRPVKLRRLAGRIVPEIALKLTLRGWRTLECRKGTLLLGNLNTRLLRCKVDVLKDLAVDLASLLGCP